MGECGKFMLLAATAVFACADGVSAKPQAAATPPLKPIDPAVADVNALSVSLRDFSVDLRQPVGFTNVYRVPGQPGMLMRSSGAVYAVFPNSTYVKSPIGLLAKVPAGTVYYIGLPPHDAPDTDEQPLPHGGIDLRISLWQDNRLPSSTDARIDTFIHESIATPADSSSGSGSHQSADRAAPNQRVVETAALIPTVANHEGYRARRLAELLQRAARAAMTERESRSRGRPDGNSNASR